MQQGSDDFSTYGVIDVDSVDVDSFDDGLFADESIRLTEDGGLIIDGDAIVPEDSPILGPDEGSKRLRGIRNRHAMTPREILDWHRIPGENVIMVDSPSLWSMLLENAPLTAGCILAIIILLIFGFTTSQFLVAGLGFIVLGVVLSYFIVRRIAEVYTMYVITNFRVIKLWGVFSLSAAWIPWGKVTDVRLIRTFWGRLGHYATLYIDSANEQSGLKDMRNLTKPKEFYKVLTAMVQLKQGNAQAEMALPSFGNTDDD